MREPFSEDRRNFETIRLARYWMDTPSPRKLPISEKKAFLPHVGMFQSTQGRERERKREKERERERERFSLVSTPTYILLV